MTAKHARTALDDAKASGRDDLREAACRDILCRERRAPLYLGTVTKAVVALRAGVPCKG
jgi:hypothetical protein